jgi:acyl-CoA thioesterase-1
MKKNRMLAVVCCLCVACMIMGCSQTEIKNLNARGKNIICFGDSITFGYGAEPGEDYPSALRAMTSIPVLNAGVDGNTTEQALKRLESDVLSQEPLLVIIEIGGNDFLRKIPMGVTIKNVAYMIEKAQEKGAMVALVDISAGMLLGQYRSAFQKIAREKGAIFVPSILKGIITNPSLKSDFMHPNGKGYFIVAHRIYRAIIPYLNKNSLLRN